MRVEVAELIEQLRATRVPELRALVAAARLDGPAAAPSADVVEPYRWFLERIGDGVTLTAAGWLPPALVVETMERFAWRRFGRENREEHARPVADLRASARQLGLVRVYRRQLRCTDAGRRLRDDPTGLWQHIASRLPLGRDEPERAAGVLWLLAVAARRPDVDETVAQGMWALGWATGDGRPLDRYETFSLVRDTWVVLDRLGFFPDRDGRRQAPTEFAAGVARAVLVAEAPVPRPTRPVPSFELEVTLRDVEPRVWRRIVVPESLTLRGLHDVLQVAMGWHNSHLFLFAIGDRDYADLEDADDMGNVDRTTLGAVIRPGMTFRYDYDFGDGWEHDVRVVGTTPADGPHCLDGARACPPEDCGGPGGYAELCEALADPSHRDHDALADWLGGPFDPAAFDREAVDAALTRLPGRKRR
jgi:hypothetical protein